MPQPSASNDDLSVDLSNLTADLPNPNPNPNPNPTPKGPFSSTFSSTFSSDFSSTFQSNFSSPGFTSNFSSNFTIDLGKPDYSSINLPTTGVNVPNVTSDPSTARAKPETMEPTADDRPAEAAPSPSAEGGRPRGRATRFRFKSKDKAASRSTSPDREPPRHHRRHHRSSRAYRDDHRHDDFRDDREGRDNPGRDDDGERRHRRHERRRRRRGGEAAPAAPPPGEPDPLDPEPPLDPETAFRESLFDAMADDEGAAYWEAIYGQPVHVYPREAANPATGELERMTEDEYAAHVRQKMWEKTHAGLLEERARRRAAREARARREREREAEADEERRVRREVERSLRRGDERRRRREWTGRFREYADAWEGWAGGGGPEGIPWPTRSGRGRDVGDEEEVRRFFVRGLDLEALGEREFAARLKEQRVRWHPDKMQQRLGGKEKVDERVMKDVTAVFQVIDTLYDDIRSKSK